MYKRQNFLDAPRMFLLFSNLVAATCIHYMGWVNLHLYYFLSSYNKLLFYLNHSCSTNLYRVIKFLSWKAWSSIPAALTSQSSSRLALLSFLRANLWGRGAMASLTIPNRFQYSTKMFGAPLSLGATRLIFLFCKNRLIQNLWLLSVCLI